MTAALGLQLLLLLLILAGSFFFSSSETALFSLSSRHLEGLDERDPRAHRVRRLLAHPQRLLVLLLLGNNLVNIAAAVVSNRIVQQSSAHFALAPVWTAVLSVFIATALLLVVGEIGPKTIALQVPAALAKLFAGPLLLVDRTLGPIVRFLFGATTWTMRVLGIERPPQAHVSEEELRTIVSVGEEEGVLEEDEREMIGRVFSLGETLVREVFVPRPDIIRVNAQATVRDVLKYATQFGHSRLPVVGETIDDIRGLVHVKDLIPFVRGGKLDHPIEELLRPIELVPDTKRADDCLRDFRRKGIHLAIVIDEYGGTAGLITLEDLIEEVVGDIFDEYDDDELPILQLDDRRWRVDASVPLSDLVHEWGEGLLPETEYDTLGGLVLELFGRFPDEGERVERDGITYTVEGVGKNRLKRVLVAFPEDDATLRPQTNGHARREGGSSNGHGPAELAGS